MSTKRIWQMLMIEIYSAKTFGEDNQVKITTSYMINNNVATDNIVEDKLNEGLKTTGLDCKS